MKIQKIYLDTSVIGGCFDEEFQIWSNALIAQLHKSSFIPIVSSIVTEEINKAPESIKEKYQEIINSGCTILTPDNESFELLKQYQSHSIVSSKFENDMLHIALATVANADILVSWNFKHIVRYDKIRQFNAVNLESGYKMLSIYSPREVVFNVDEKEI